jgi:hypothetical protein
LEILHGLQNANGAAPIRASGAHAQEAIAEREADSRALSVNTCNLRD